jgi:predicted RNA methylase
MTYYLNESEWMNSTSIPEGMNLDMLNTVSNRLEQLLKPALHKQCKDSIVIDLGAGTGVLGLFALECGAKFVYFVERDPQMFHILENVISKKLLSSQYKLITKDIEDLTVEDFDMGTPNITVSEFYGPRLFDEGYVNYTKHMSSMFPKIQFIPETFRVDFYLNNINYKQSIWPTDSNLIDHFKFMYKEKGFAKYIRTIQNLCVGSIEFNANTQTFNNNMEFTFNGTKELLLIGVASIKHNTLHQSHTTFGWLLDESDTGKTFRIYFDTDNHFNPRKIEV